MATTRKSPARKPAARKRAKAARSRRMGAAPKARARSRASKTTYTTALEDIIAVGGGMVGGFLLSGLIGKHAPPHNQHLRNGGIVILSILGAVNTKKGSAMQKVAIGLGAGAAANSAGAALTQAGLMNGSNGSHTDQVRQLSPTQRARLLEAVRQQQRMAEREPYTLNGAMDVVTMNGDYI